MLVVVILSLSYSFILMLASCSGEHIVEPEPVEKPAVEEPQQTTETAIAFMADLPEQQAVTRSTPLETIATSFKVWGFKNMSFVNNVYGSTQTVFPGFNVNWTANTAYTTTSNSHEWEYVGLEDDDANLQTIKYWDFGACAYRFFAVAPSTAGTITDDSNNNALCIKFPADASSAAAKAATPYYSHLWLSDNSDSRFGKPVTLEFIQPLARVRFMITYPPLADGVEEPVLENFDFRPVDEDTRIALKGDVIITFPKQGSATKESWVTSWVDPSRNMVSMTRPYITGVDEYWETVLPILGPTESGGQGAYVLKVTVNGEDKSCTVPAHFMSWSPGYQYTYVFKVDAEGGLKLDNVWVGVTEMEVLGEEEYILYNW